MSDTDTDTVVKGQKQPVLSAVTPITDPSWVGMNIFVRTVTHYHVGRVAGVYLVGTVPYLVLEDCAWIANTGRLGEAMCLPDKLSETEPFPAPVHINMTAVVDYTQYLFDIERYRVPVPN